MASGDPVTRSVFWASLGLAGYVYLVFPFILVVRAALFRRPINADTARPLRISVLIAARNEEAVIGRKLDSILDDAYPADLREVIVATNGCTDGSAAVVGQYQDRGVRLIGLAPVGKAQALDAAVRASTGEVLVFTDANGELFPGALWGLVRPFGDPAVGGVAGDQRYLSEPNPNAIGAGERRYWGIERFLKRTESTAGDVIAATGGLYAIRREFYEPIPSGVTDDAFLSMGVVAKRSRLVFAPEAVVSEPLSPAPHTELWRKVRIVTRGLRTLWVRRRLLNPFRFGFYAVQLWSHKVLRRLMPLPLLAILTTSILLSARPIYRFAALAQVSLYSIGVAGLLLARTKVASKPLVSVPAYFLAANVAALLGLVNVLRGISIEQWQPMRGPDAGAPNGTNKAGGTLARRGAERVLALASALVVGYVAGEHPGPVVVLVVVVAISAVLALRPDLAALAALGLLYSNAIVLGIERHGLPAVAALSVPALLLVPLVESLVARRQSLIVPAALPFVGSFAIVQAVSAVQATDKARAMASLSGFALEGLGVYFVVVNVVRSRELLVRSMRVLLLVGALISLLVVAKGAIGDYKYEFGGFAQARTPGGISAESVETEDFRAARGGFLRQTGPLNGPGRFGQYWLPLVPIALFLSYRARTRAGRLAFGFAGALVVAGIILSFTRGAFVGLLASGAVLILLRVVRKGPVIAGLALIVALMVAIPSYRERVFSLWAVTDVIAGDTSDADTSIEGRFTENVAALYMFRDHPILGVGPANYAPNYRMYANFEPTNVRTGERQAHNLYLAVAAETGVLGLIAILGVFGASLWELVQARRRAWDAEGRWIASASITVVVGLMVTSAFLHFAFIRYFWMFMALTAAGAKVAAMRTKVTPPTVGASASSSIDALP